MHPDHARRIKHIGFLYGGGYETNDHSERKGGGCPIYETSETAASA